MSTLRTNAILDASGGTTATVNGIPLRPGVLDPENRIINGAFDFWQRGTSFTASVFGSDRWYNAVASGGTVTQSRQAFALGDTLGSNSPTYFLRQSVTGTTASSHYAITMQMIESVRSYAGQTITVLGWARRSSGSGNMAVELEQNFGTGGSPSAGVYVPGQTVTLTGSWAPFALTFSVPSISGKTLGSNNNDYLRLTFWTSAGSDYNARTNSLGLQTIGVDLWGIHIKQGTHTTSAVDLYRQPELGPELARCQRYYERFDIAGAASYYLGMGMMWATNAGRLVVPYKMQKRAIPSVFVSGTLRFGDGTGIGVVTSFAVDGPSVDTALVYGTFSSGSGTQGRAAQVYTDTTFSLGIDAEL